MPWGSNHAVQSVAVHAPKFWLWFCAVSWVIVSLSIIFALTSSNSCTMSIFECCCKNCVPPTTEFLSRSIDLNRETTVYSMCQLYKERTHICKFPLFYRGYLGRLIHHCGLYISMWQQFWGGDICKNAPGWAEVFKYVQHQVDFTNHIVEHCIEDSRKERVNETWIPKLPQEWLIIEFHIGSVSTSACQWCEKTPSWYLLPILQSSVSQA